MHYAHPEYLIEPEALNEHLDAKDLRIYDATVNLVPAERGYRAESGRDAYLGEHIPGAAFLDHIQALSDPSSGLGFTLPTPAALESALQSAGINANSQVVVYSSGHMMWATRAWWLLHYAGVADVRVLNGGLRGWQEQGLTTRSGEEAYPAGTLAINPQAERFVDRDQVLAAIGDSAICTVNALAEDVYTGDAKMSYGRKGHITGSVNVPYATLLDQGRFLPAAALSDALRSGGLLGPEPVYAYCGGGISATIDAFALKLIGKHNVAVYDGSMSEWVRDEALPMTTGPAAS